MNFLREKWYYAGGVLFIALAFLTIFFDHSIDPRQTLLIAVFMTMLAHQFEEYAIPGGFPMFWNIGVSGEKIRYDRYPLNKQNSAISNVSLWIVYVIAIIFYDVYFLGLMVSYMGFGQLIMHGVIINKKSKTLYNPGLGTTILLLIPVGIYYI